MRPPSLSPIPIGEFEREVRSFRRLSFRRTVHFVVAALRFSRGLRQPRTRGRGKRRSEMGNALSEPITDKKSACQASSRIMVGSSCMQGWRNTMEDAHVHLLDFTGENDDQEQSCYFAVFDGHFNGAVAEFCGENLHLRLKANKNYIQGNVSEALRECCLSLDAEILDDPPNFRRSGSTGVIVVCRKDTLYCANVGDSRAVACVAGRAVPLSFDHKPYKPEEEKRIVAAGGFVHANRVNGSLAVSRGFGDSELKEKKSLPAEEQMVTANPEITQEDLTKDHEFFILACDGIWDCKSSQQVVDFVRERIAQKMLPDQICEELMMSCLSPETRRDGLGCDNMTVVLSIMLNGEQYEHAATLCRRPCSPSVHANMEDEEESQNDDTPMDANGDGNNKVREMCEVDEDSEAIDSSPAASPSEEASTE